MTAKQSQRKPAMAKAVGARVMWLSEGGMMLSPERITFRETLVLVLDCSPASLAAYEEAVAKAMFNDSTKSCTWESDAEWSQEMYRRKARAALEALHPAMGKKA